MTAFIRKTWKFCEQCLRFFWKNDDPSQTVATARIAPKSARAGPLHIAHTVLDFIQIGSLSAELLRTREDRFCPLEYLQYSLFDPIMNFN